MSKIEYKTILLPYKTGIFQDDSTDLTELLNKEGAEGWHLSQIVLPSTVWGRANTMIAIMQRTAAEDVARFLSADPITYYDLKPTRAWLPSQNGLVLLAPQRHSRADSTRATTRPVPLMISMLPRTCSGPSVSGSMASGPSRTGSMSALPVGGSPLAAKFTS